MWQQPQTDADATVQAALDLTDLIARVAEFTQNGFRAFNETNAHICEAHAL